MIQRAASEYMEAAQQYAVEAAPMLFSKDSDNLFILSKDAGNDQQGRIIITDDRGIVQTDGFSQLNGIKLQNSELLHVLTGTQDSAFGYHLLPASSDIPTNAENTLLYQLQRMVSKSRDGYEWVVYCAVPIVSESKNIGALLLSASIEPIVEQTSLIRWQMLLVIMAAGVAILIISAALSGAMVQPIKMLTQGIHRIEQGDFTQRVDIAGHSEMARLADTFNHMSERLESVDRTRNEFVANASHELKTPMATIKVLVETLQHQNPPNPAMTEEFLGDINSEIDRMTALVTELLSLTRQDEGGSDALMVQSLDISTLARDACEIVAPLADKKPIHLHRDIQPDIQLLGDRDRLKRMMINLIDNGVKYTPQNGSVHVSLRSDNKMLTFVVADTGIGIEQDKIPYIFDRFYRVDKARARETGGTGLGLAIVKSIILLHQGEIRVHSTPGEGTTMTVTLPLRKA